MNSTGCLKAYPLLVRHISQFLKIIFINLLCNGTPLSDHKLNFQVSKAMELKMACNLKFGPKEYR